jgi:hypothetical protein
VFVCFCFALADSSLLAPASSRRKTTDKGKVKSEAQSKSMTKGPPLPAAFTFTAVEPTSYVVPSDRRYSDTPPGVPLRGAAGASISDLLAWKREIRRSSREFDAIAIALDDAAECRRRAWESYFALLGLVFVEDQSSVLIGEPEASASKGKGKELVIIDSDDSEDGDGDGDGEDDDYGDEDDVARGLEADGVMDTS